MGKLRLPMAPVPMAFRNRYYLDWLRLWTTLCGGGSGPAGGRSGPAAARRRSPKDGCREHQWPPLGAVNVAEAVERLRQREESEVSAAADRQIQPGEPGHRRRKLPDRAGRGHQTVRTRLGIGNVVAVVADGKDARRRLT